MASLQDRHTNALLAIGMKAHAAGSLQGFLLVACFLFFPQKCKDIISWGSRS